MNRILASKFDAEKEWDNDEVVKLPAVKSVAIRKHEKTQ